MLINTLSITCALPIITFWTSALIALAIEPTAFNFSLFSGLVWCFGWAGAAGATGAGAGAGITGAAGIGAGAAGIGAAGIGAAGAGITGAAGATGAAGIGAGGAAGGAGGCMSIFLQLSISPTTDLRDNFTQFFVGVGTG